MTDIIVSLIDANSILRMRTIKGADDWTPPEGYTAIEADGQIGQRWSGTAFYDVVEYPTSADVNAERDRRIASGFAYGGKVIQFDGDSQANILGACQMAVLGILPQPFMWITSDNSLISLTAQQVIEMGAVGAAHKQAMIFAARTLKDMQPIPANYADDSRWAP